MQGTPDGGGQPHEHTCAATVRNNAALLDLHGLEGLQSAGSLIIASNDGLETLTGLDVLANLDSELNLYQNAALVTLDGIEALATVKARVRLAGHTTLVDVTALTGAVVGPGPPARIDIVENAMLPQCEAEALAEALKAPGWMGSQDVRDNLGECP